MSYQFQGQRPSEDVLLITRQHPFVLLHSLLWAALILLIPFAIYMLWPTGPVLSLSIVLAVIFGGLKLGAAWYGWSRTLLLLTNERVIFLEQHGFFRRELIESSLQGVQQISHMVHGLLHTAFGYGNLNLATAASQQPIIVPNIPDPYAIQQAILQAQKGDGFIEEDTNE